ncbi:MAG: phosphatidylserine decarboxylase [Myxococcota bacterium]
MSRPASADPSRPLEGRIAPQAWPGTLGLGLVAGISALAGLGSLAGASGLAGLANLAFFRNPRRHPPSGDRLAVSPADGRVVEVAELAEPDPFVGVARRVAIFLSILDVHVNRVPLSGKVRALRRSGNQYRAAFRAEASARNVQVRLDVETPAGIRYALVQITGLIARRIVCRVDEGSALERGRPYGLICYGSRVELIVPTQVRIQVRPGDRVRGGETVIAEVGP